MTLLSSGTIILFTSSAHNPQACLSSFTRSWSSSPPKISVQEGSMLTWKQRPLSATSCHYAHDRSTKSSGYVYIVITETSSISSPTSCSVGIGRHGSVIIVTNTLVFVSITLTWLPMRCDSSGNRSSIIHDFRRCWTIRSITSSCVTPRHHYSIVGNIHDGYYG